MNLDILIPTCDRPDALAVTLTSLAAQTERDFRVVVSDQGQTAAESCGVVLTAARVLRAHGNTVEFHRHLPRRGMAEQRQFLLDRTRAPYALFLDDDLILEPWVVAQMTGAIRDLRCGFVGSAVIGLSYAEDVRPDQQRIEFWEGPFSPGLVRPERVEPDSEAWARHSLHNAANLWHVQRDLNLTPDRTRAYRVAWVGGCVLYDVRKLRDVGAFGFWRELPDRHAGEDVLAQLRVMDRHGGCGLIPSGVYHLELPTTVTDRRVDAPRVLPVVPNEAPREEVS